MHFTTLLLIFLATPALAGGLCPHGGTAQVDTCYKVHGALSIHDRQRPTLYVPEKAATYPIASTVSQSPEQYDWPSEIEAMVRPGLIVWGDFAICPQVDPDEPDTAMVCINNTARLKTMQ